MKKNRYKPGVRIDQFRPREVPFTSRSVNQDEATRAKYVQSDGWMNLLTGVGIKGLDKTQSTRFGADNRLEYQELTQIYRSEGIGRRVIDLPVHDMYREWFKIEGDTDGIIDKRMKMLNAKKQFKRAQRFGYLYGGALAIMGINDGGRYQDPVRENRIKSIEHIHVFDRWRITLNTADLYIDPDMDKYGKPEYYNIVPIYGAPFRVHESRVLRFEGVDIADQVRIQNQGWGDSTLQAIYNRLSALGEAYCSVGTVLQEFILGVLTIDNLMELIAAGKESVIQKRLTQMDLSKHIINSVLIDKEEKYERISTTTTGMADLMDKLIEAVSAVTGIPVCLLMGRSVGGLSAEDAAQVRFYYDKIAAQQEEDALPQIQQFVRYLNIAEKNVLGDEWDIVFNPLWQPTEKEIADTRFVQAQCDQIYIDRAVLTPEEVSVSRFGGDHYSYDTALSPEHQRMLEAHRQKPSSTSTAIAAVKSQGKETTPPEDRLGVLKTTDYKTMATPLKTSKYADKPGPGPADTKPKG
jgi:phage-related protein (TIGR01555 family)